MILLKFFLIALILGQPEVAVERRKPVCNAATVGDFWPSEANRDRIALARFARTGELELCGHGIWRYHWMHLTVQIHRLAKKPSAQDAAEVDKTTPFPQ